jgi:hypothetical protein
MHDYGKILDEAFAAADAAIAKRFDEGHREQPFNCGFAWVTIPGTHPLARYCRKIIRTELGMYNASRDVIRRYGDRGYPKGHQWWKPGSWPANAPDRYQQDMSFHYAGAHAFAKVLKAYGIDAKAHQRQD